MAKTTLETLVDFAYRKKTGLDLLSEQENKTVLAAATTFLPSNFFSPTTTLQLNFTTTTDSLRRLFEPYGELLEVKIPLETVGRNKGFGFVLFKNDQDAFQATQALNGTNLDGQHIIVQVSEKRGPGGFRAPPPPPPSQQQAPSQRGLRSPPRGAERYPPPKSGGGGGNFPQPVVTVALPPPSTMDGKIYVSGLPPNTTEDMLADHFSLIGQISRKKQKRGYPDQWPYNIRLYMGENGKFKGDALVTFEDPNAALTAPGFFNGGEFHGSTIKVEVAKKE